MTLLAKGLRSSFPANGRRHSDSSTIKINICSNPLSTLYSSGSVTKKPSFHRPAPQSGGFDYLWVPRYQVDSLITPSDLLALDIKHDTLDGTLTG